ncbi:hypothetical protein DICPUDRAFT_157926 [Dictyostelium purpureum]|uniref:Uncharacterized protein n=1 Tax=Dictyostelium purpureum TaxID=5786 RepID=F1A0D4_DICPU|nr:uncharacterized protein DICPUDRAFT_157926 [Dictyostelium purpureum]EGC30358.1 hypothetical protein DICPUDRAFT_157926 [Dictyostelium purpureum]|eukprot:XP_003293128.1 hypothetical protein DICPUDRAFT_157926 [Dictyostelium purpureum]
MVRIITRRSSQLQKRNRIQIINLKQALCGSSNKSSKDTIIRKKVLKSKDIPKVKKESNTTPAKSNIITRSSKLYQLNVKKEPQQNNKINLKQEVLIITRSNIIKNIEFINNYNKLSKYKL